MALGIRSLIDSAKKLSQLSPLSPLFPQHASSGKDVEASTAKTMTELFPATDAQVDGDDCTHDCESCHVVYPRGFKIDESDVLYGHIKGWSSHVLVATGKSDWVRDVEDEKGSVMQAFGKADKPTNGRLMLSASNMPTPGGHAGDYSQPTLVLLLPAFVLVDNVTPEAVPTLVREFIEQAPTNTSRLKPLGLPQSLPAPSPTLPELLARPCPHSALVLLCSQKTRDARCGQSAPLLRKELERHLRPLGLFRDLDDERPGGVGIYFISHVGGHKYSANVMVYRRPDAFGVDHVERAKLVDGEALMPVKKVPREKKEADVVVKPPADRDEIKDGDDDEDEDVGAAQCIWLARVKPEDCENLVKYTILQGKVVKPGSQLRGGFDRSKGLLSW